MAYHHESSWTLARRDAGGQHDNMCRTQASGEEGQLCGRLGFTATTQFLVALPCLAAAGFALVVSGIGAQTLLQSAVAAAMRGRIMALYGMIFRGGPAFGALLMGAFSERFGLRAPVAAGALLCVLYWLWVRLHEPIVAHQFEVAAESAE